MEGIGEKKRNGGNKAIIISKNKNIIKLIISLINKV